MPRPIAGVDLSTFAENVRLVRQHLPAGCDLLAVVKADAYGHGIAPISQAAEAAGILRLGAASVEEGRAIRRAGVHVPILLLDPVPLREFRPALELGLEISVDALAEARHASEVARAVRSEAQIHLDVDLGMSRFGASLDSAFGLLAEISALPCVRVGGIFGHLPRADSKRSADQRETRRALAAFRTLLDGLDRRGFLPPLRHVGNSAAAIQYPDVVATPPLNLVRIGTLLYGYPEVHRPWTSSVRPVASLEAQVISLREVQAGARVGYGRGWRARSRRRIAVLGVGYADGLPSALGNRGKVLLHGRLAPIVGRICLDHTFVDVTGIPETRPGDVASLFGPHYPADIAAANADLPVCELLVPALRGAERLRD